MRRFTEKILNPTAGKKLITPDNWEARTHPPRTNTTMSMKFFWGMGWWYRGMRRIIGRSED
jgi:hypothetical protein